MELRAIDRFGATHHGIATLQAALAAGVSEAAWYRALRTGELEALHPGVARMPGSPRTREQRIMAAVLGAGPGAMASHRSGAHLWGVRRPDHDPVDVVVDRRTTSARLHHVVVHHPRDLEELRPIVRSGIATTSPMRMLLDLGAVDRPSVPSAVDQIVSTRIVSPAALHSFLLRHQRPGRSGVRALRSALARWNVGEDHGDSVLEAKMAALARRHGLPTMVFHPILEGFEVDFLVEGSMVVIECDGHQTHGLDRDQFEFDRVRNVLLVAAGYVIVHVTWNQLHRHPADLARRLVGVIRRWAPELLPAPGNSGRAS